METKTSINPKTYDDIFCEHCHKNIFVFIKNFKSNKFFSLDEYLCVSCGRLNYFQSDIIFCCKQITSDTYIETKF